MFWNFWKKKEEEILDLELEIITDKFISNEYLEDLLKRNSWSCKKETKKIDGNVDVFNKEGKLVLIITINRLVHGKEVYMYDDEDDIKLIKKDDKRFSKFTPYYNYITFKSDCYDEMTEFLYMLKNDGRRVFYAFNLMGDRMKELKHQL